MKGKPALHIKLEIAITWITRLFEVIFSLLLKLFEKQNKKSSTV